MREKISRSIKESIRVKNSLLKTQLPAISSLAGMMSSAIKSGNKILIFGNGGSASDAQHIAGELVGRFRMDRAALPAIALTTDPSLLTALANDYGYDTVFRRQVEALGSRGDVLIALTTSGTSANILQAAAAARDMGIFVIGLTGQTGGKLKSAADLTIMVPSMDTPRIQEAHITIAHIICQLVESELFHKGSV